MLLKVLILSSFLLSLYADDIEDSTVSDEYKVIPFDVVIESAKFVTDSIVNYDKTLDSVKSAYSKPLQTEFEYLDYIDSNNTENK